MTAHKSLSFSIPSSIQAIDEAVARIVAFATEASFDEASVFGIDLAAREGLANAVKHGNLLDEEKLVRVTVTVSGGDLEISIVDEGAGFVPDEVPDPTDPANLLKDSGRGLLFIRNFMDDAEWLTAPEGGTLLKMHKLGPRF